MIGTLGVTLRDGQAAAAELRERLRNALATTGKTQEWLAHRAGVARTTVHYAFEGPTLPSPQTVSELAKVLGLPEEELLRLRRVAAKAAKQSKASTEDRPGPGRWIGEWDPHDLEVHPAGLRQEADGSDAAGRRVLPGYVRREHDQVLSKAVEDAAAGRSRMVVLVGSSSTGKTRACWEAVQPLAGEGWRLWHPFDPTRAEAALADLHRVGPRTVVWLNEAQHYLGDKTVGEEIAAAVHSLLTDPLRGPVLILGTLWPRFLDDYRLLPQPGESDPHSRVRELLAGRIVHVPEAFDAAALASATQKATEGDPLLADALTRAGADGRLAQDLAGGPALLERYRSGSPAARALLQAAMDARRLGIGLHLPQAFLTDAAADYIHDTDWNQLTDDWAEAAYAELARHVHGKQAPLTRIIPRPQRRPPGSPPAHIASAHTQGPVFRLADYLEQHGRTERRYLCPPTSFWHAAHTHLIHPEDLHSLATAADERHRLQWAHHLLLRAAEHGQPDALKRLAEMREETGDRDGAEALARQAADRGHPGALMRLAEMREETGDRDGAEALYQQAADHGHPAALVRLAWRRERAGDRDGAEALYQQVTDDGRPGALMRLAEMRERAGDRDGAEALYQQAADRGYLGALKRLAEMRERAGDRDGAEALARQAADRGHPGTLKRLAEMRERAGDRDGAEALARQAADDGYLGALMRLAAMRERAGDLDGAEALARQAADDGYLGALITLAAMRERAGDLDGAEALARQAADHGHPGTLITLAAMREKAGDQDEAEAFYQQAADHGHPGALMRLAAMREKAGDRDEAEAFYQQAADHGNPGALMRLAEMREKAGDRDGAEALARQAADRGHRLMVVVFRRRWPYGLDPDGTPSLPWQ
ncbi:helix-turn-helix domain-containing/SEL1-like repeat protein [Streptomyces pseudogriseolus]|uniref:helix-turn-helix domain-containing protein n=1 Tax=Streptomyces pseudogriseolus TaxID=36817 RepID=UPI000A3B3E21